MDREISSVLSLAEPLAQTMGYEILKAEIVHERGDKVLRLFLDRPGGIGVEDCQRFSEALGPILDVEAEVQGSYHLEISSPGLDRPLNKLEHFRAQLGKIVQVTTEEPIEGRRHFKGELTQAEAVPEAVIELNVDQELYRIELSRIKKAHLDFFASEAKQREADSPTRGKKPGKPDKRLG